MGKLQVTIQQDVNKVQAKEMLESFTPVLSKNSIERILQGVPVLMSGRESGVPNVTLIKFTYVDGEIAYIEDEEVPKEALNDLL